jgi:hypothetical protein
LLELIFDGFIVTFPVRFPIMTSLLKVTEQVVLFGQSTDEDF